MVFKKEQPPRMLMVKPRQRRRASKPLAIFRFSH